MHLHDIHAPFQDEAALDVAYQLVEHVQPDVIVVGSDAADFTLLSSFDPDPDINEEIDDELEGFKAFWYEHINTLRKIAPDATLVYIYGNHEWRILRYLEQNAPKLRKTVLKAWKDVLRAGGAVLYLGEVDWVRMGGLVVMHGSRVGENAAKLQLQDVGHQVSVMAGHVHRISNFEKAGEDFPVVSAVGGCLCKPSHYMRGKARNKWQLGTIVASVDLNGRYVHFDNLRFEQDADRVWVRFERKEFSSEKE